MGGTDLVADLLLDGFGGAAGFEQGGAGDFQLLGVAVEQGPGELFGTEVFIRETLQATGVGGGAQADGCLLYTSPSPRDS